jgi:glyoxylase-like metal-dependent hydrolase (beta-lactamase superfamily II)
VNHSANGAPASADVFDAAGACDVVPLPGHFFGMVGVMTPDRVFFAADALAGAPILEKYGVFFLYDIAAELETLALLESMEAEWFVPSHAEPVRDIRPLVTLNRDKILEIADVLVGLCRGPTKPGTAATEATATPGASFEDLLAGICERYSVKLDAGQYVLVGSTIRSYLSWLCSIGRLEYEFTNGRMIYKEQR